MAKLKCTNCGNVFNKKALATYSSAGATGAKVGVGYSLILWPFTLRVYSKCPVCKQTGWIRVLPPWSKS